MSKKQKIKISLYHNFHYYYKQSFYVIESPFENGDGVFSFSYQALAESGEDVS